MAILKCKMCGGDIQATDNAYGTCESCGSTMTLPKANDDRKANLFNRANHYRRQNDFDKAAQAYDNILNEDAADAEAHWGVVLSRYGIEYVEDPATRQRIPTCHRVQSESILTDADYVAALENAPDEYTKSLYAEEAKKISDIQKGILAISNKEEPYDVFICYKETTDGGSRTKDSTIAQDIYYELSKDGGYRVFFAKITLEDKLGQQYEPYIFSALNTSRVMLVIGTRKEYFEATWVKNEWSRFLAIMKKDRSRLLIPCYRDMDAYDIPEELSNLQCQDMSKVGFIQDILRGVKKVLDAGKSAEKTPSGVTAGVAVAAPGVESLLKRGKLFLEDSDWKQANEYFDKVLDIDPEYAPAYVGKLCVELKVCREELLGDYDSTLLVSNFGNFQKAVRFADVDYKAKLNGYEEGRKRREEERKRQEEERKRQEEERKRQEEERARSERYDRLVQAKERASNVGECENIAKQFRVFGNYKNAIKLAIECDVECKRLRNEEVAIRLEQLETEEADAKKETKKRIHLWGGICLAILLLCVLMALLMPRRKMAWEVFEKRKQEQMRQAWEVFEKRKQEQMRQEEKEQ